MKTLVLTAVAAIAAGQILAQEARELTFMTAVPAKTAPVIDGDLDEPCWKAGVKHVDFFQYWVPNPRRVKWPTEVTVLYDRSGVYVGTANLGVDPKTIKRLTLRDGLMSMHNDDCNEIHFDPDAKGIGFYRFAVNANGKYKASWQFDSANLHNDWDAPGIKCAAKIVENGWTVELFVPWEAFHGRSMPSPGTVWCFNENRYIFSQGWSHDNLMCSAPGASYASVGNFGYLYFSDGSRPDATKVLEILEARLKTLWGIRIGDRVYLHDVKGTRVADLESRHAATVADWNAKRGEAVKRIDALAAAKVNVRDFTNVLAKASEQWEKETGAYDGSFSAVKSLGQVVDRLVDLGHSLALEELFVFTNGVPKPLELPLAGTYDLEKPPKDANGFCGWYRHNPRRDAYVTPHYDWAPRSAGRRLKALFMTDRGHYVGTLRDAVEFVQRFDVEPLWMVGDFGANGAYEDPLSHGTPLDKARQFETLLAKDPDVFVFYGLRTIPAKYLYEIMRRIAFEGRGLLVIGQQGQFAQYLRRAKTDVAARAEIAAATAPAAFRAARDREPRFDARVMSADEACVNPTVFGRGRMIWLDLQRGEWSLAWKAAYESRFAAFRRALGWAAGEKPAAAVEFASGTGRETLDARAKAVAFTVKGAAGDRAAAAVRVRNEWNEVVFERDCPLAGAETAVLVPVAALPGGEYALDVMVRTAGGTDAVAAHSFFKRHRLGREMWIDGTNATFVAENTARSFAIDFGGSAPNPVKLEVKLLDRPYRQVRRVWTQDLPARRYNAFVALERCEFPTTSGELHAKLVDAVTGETLAEQRKVVYFPNHRQDVYPMISWGIPSTGFSPEFFAPQLMEKFGYRNNLGGNDGRWPALFNGKSVPYSCRVGLGPGTKGGVVWWQIPRQGRLSHKECYEKLDENCSPYSPAAREYIESVYTNTVKTSAPYGVCVYSFGDECGYSNDLGLKDVENFAKFLAGKYGTVERYNRAHGTSIADFSEAQHLSIKECQEKRDWPLWFDNVQFSEQIYADTYNFLSELVHKFDPKGRTGAEGSAPGDLELTVRNLKFWGPYRALVNDELLKNVNPDAVRATWWGGYLGHSTRDGFPGQQWEFLLTGTVNADEWYSITPGGTESAFAGDLTLAPYAQEYLPHLNRLRRGTAQLLIKTPFRHEGFALYYSHPSVRAAGVMDGVLSPEGGLRDLINFCYRHGYDVKMVTPRTLKKLDGEKALFLAGASALSDEEIAAFAGFAKRGGIIATDSVPGLYDQFLAKRAGATGLEGVVTDLGGYRDHAKIQAFLDRKGVKPVESVTGLPDGAVILRTRVLGDMKLVGLKTTTQQLGKDVTIGFGGKGFVYEVDAGFAGETDAVELRNLAIPFKLYAQFPKAQSAPAFDLGVPAAGLPPGSFVKYGTKQLRQGSVYRLTVAGPDGEEIANRTEVFVADPRREPVRSFQFPFSDRPGAYAVTLVDLATGLKTVQTVVLTKNS